MYTARAKRRNRHHITLRASHKVEIQIAARLAVGSLGLYIHTVDTVEHIEIVDIYRTVNAFIVEKISLIGIP